MDNKDKFTNHLEQAIIKGLLANDKEILSENLISKSLFSAIETKIDLKNLISKIEDIKSYEFK